MPLATLPRPSSAGATTASACTPCTSLTAARTRSTASSTPATDAASASASTSSTTTSGRAATGSASSGRTSPTATAPRGAQALNLDDADSDEVRRFIIDNALMWLRDFHVDGLRLDAVHALFDVRAITLLEELSAEVSALSTGLGRPLWLIAESDRNDPLTGHAARGRRSRPARAVGRRRTPCAARAADRRDAGLLRRLRRPRRTDQGAGAACSCTTGPTRRSGAARTVDRSTAPRTPGWRFVASLQTHDQVGNRAIGDRLSAATSHPGRWPAVRRCC